jgi:hypothetical protein
MGDSREVGGRPLLARTIEAAHAAASVDEVVVAADSQATAELAVELGALAPFLRPPELSRSYVDVWEVVRYALGQLNGHVEPPELVLLLEETYPLRSPELIDALVGELLERDLDTLIAAREETHALWLDDGTTLRQVGDGFMPRHLKETRALVGLVGLGCVTHASMVRTGDVYSGNLGLFEVEDRAALIEVRDAASAAVAEHLLANGHT